MRSKCPSWLAVYIAAVGLLAGCKQAPAPKPVEKLAPEKATSVRATIGPEGGMLGFAGQGARLLLPKGLLAERLSVEFSRYEPTLDLAGTDVIGKAYRIEPAMSFTTGQLELRVPLDRALPGGAEPELYYFGRKVTTGPQGAIQHDSWQRFPYAKALGATGDGKWLRFSMQKTPDVVKKPPFGLLQAAFETK